MKIVHFKDAESYEPQEHWKRTSLCNENDISIEHFVKPPGHASPLHDHPNTQVLVVLDGALTITTGDGGEQRLEAGDAAYIPGGEAHVVTNPL
ncbi:MAG TPA: cupin domain-containing protein, partial [Patescibacteria group bacterium]|nr:cupin domain-containing protein [Patescibacteria group bacterium]